MVISEMGSRELGVKVVLPDRLLKNTETIGTTSRIVGDTFSKKILKHKYLMTSSLDTSFERKLLAFYPDNAWEYYVVIDIAFGGRGRPSKDFLNRRNESIKKYLPMVKAKINRDLTCKFLNNN